MAEETILKTIKGLADTIEAHGKAVNARLDEALKTVTGFEARVKAIEDTAVVAEKERKELLQRIPARGAAGDVRDALIEQVGIPKERQLMNEQSTVLMAALLSPRGVGSAFVGTREIEITEARLKALQIGVGAGGGFVIPRTIMTEIIQKATLKSVFLAYADIVDPADLTGTTNRENEDFTWSSTPELTQPTETTFATLLKQVPWTLTTQAAFATISNKLLKYAPIDMASWLTDKSGRSFQAKADDWFVNGTGSGEPRGLRIGENVNSSTQAAAAFDWPDLVDLEAALGIAYRPEAVFIINDTGRKLIAKLATTTGEPVFMGTAQLAKLGLTPNYRNQNGVINLPGGTSYPFFLVSGTALPSNLGTGANETEIWLGVPRYYRIWIGENMEMSQDSSGANWRAGQVQLKFTWDGDGVVTLGEAWAKQTGTK